MLFIPCYIARGPAGDGCILSVPFGPPSPSSLVMALPYAQLFDVYVLCIDRYTIARLLPLPSGLFNLPSFRSTPQAFFLLLPPLSYLELCFLVFLGAPPISFSFLIFCLFFFLVIYTVLVFAITSLWSTDDVPTDRGSLVRPVTNVGTPFFDLVFFQVP